MDVRSLGALARDAGVNPASSRYYERRGLLPEPPRTAKALGFTLAEIGVLLDGGAGSPGDVLAAARHRLAELDGEIARLGEQRRRLERLLHACEAGDAGCTSLDPLDTTSKASAR